MQHFIQNFSFLPKLVLKANEEKIFTYSVAGLKPRLWTPHHPNLYDFRFRLVANKGKLNWIV